MVFNVNTYTKMKGYIHIFYTIDGFDKDFVVYLQYHDVFAKDPIHSPKTSLFCTDKITLSSNVSIYFLFH